MINCNDMVTHFYIYVHQEFQNGTPTEKYQINYFQWIYEQIKEKLKSKQK